MPSSSRAYARIVWAAPANSRSRSGPLVTRTNARDFLQQVADHGLAKTSFNRGAYRRSQAGAMCWQRRRAGVISENRRENAPEMLEGFDLTRSWRGHHDHERI